MGVNREFWSLPRPRIVFLSVPYTPVVGHSGLIAVHRFSQTYSACPGAAHCDRLTVTDKWAFRITKIPAGTYKVATGEEVKLDSDAAGRLLPGGLLLVKDANTGKTLTPEELAEILIDYVEGERPDGIVIEGTGMTVLPGNRKPPMTVYDALKQFGSVYWYELKSVTSYIHSRTNYAECDVTGSVECKVIEQSTKLDSVAVCVFLPILNKAKESEDLIFGASSFCASWKTNCAYRGDDCEWSRECDVIKVLAKKDGTVTIKYGKPDVEATDVKQIEEEAL